MSSIPDNRPLAGIRVLDMSRVFSGPWSTQLLGDLGAEVIKVEQPGRGDDLRRLGQPGLAGGGVNLAEAVDQLMGTAGPRQLRRANNALVTGIGGIQYARNWGCSSALVLKAGA